MLRFRWKLIVALGILVLSGLSPHFKAWGQDLQVTPTKYQFTMKKFELCTNATCTASTVLAEKDQVFDTGSAVANPGETVGTYVDAIELPIGTTFTHWRATLDRTFTLRGGAVSALIAGAGACFTDGTGTGTVGSVSSPGSTTDADASGRGGTATDMVLVLPNADDAANGPVFPDLNATFAAAGIAVVDATTMTFTKALAQSVTVADTPPRLEVTFDVANTLNLQGTGADSCIMWFVEPNVTVTLR